MQDQANEPERPTWRDILLDDLRATLDAMPAWIDPLIAGVPSEEV